MKKLSLFAFTLTMLILTGCGAARSVPAAESAPAAEDYAYISRFTELGGVENYLSPRCAAPGGLYATAAVAVDNTVPEGVTPQYETQYYQYQQRLYFVGLDGTVRRLRSYEQLTLGENARGRAYYSQSSTLAAMLLDDSGALTAMEAVDESWYREIVSATGKKTLGEYSTRRRWFIRTLDADGAETARSEIALQDEDEWLDCSTAVADGSGGFIVIDRNGLRDVDAAGTTRWSIAGEQSIGSLIRLDDGRIYALSWDGRWLCRRVDPSGGALGESRALPREVYTVYGGAELCYTLSGALYKFDGDSGESSALLSWLDCDIDPSCVSWLAAQSDGGIVGVQTAYHSGSDGYMTELFELGREKVSGQSAALTLGSANVDQRLKALVIAYNRTSPNTPIRVTDYSGQDGAARLEADIRSGGEPDIIDLTGLNAPALAAQGLLTDLYPYVDGDWELDRSDYFENLLRSYEYGGALISTVDGFYLSTVIAAQSAAGDAMSWDLAALEAASAALPEEHSLMESYTTRADVLRECVALCHNELVDAANGQCSFQTELFGNILRLAALFPEHRDDSAYYSDPEDSTYFRLKTGRQLMSAVQLVSPEDIFACDADFEGDCAFVGWPLGDGVGSGLVRSWGFALSADSDMVDGAWGFLRYFFTEEYQSGVRGFPAMKELYQKRLEKAMEPDYYTDSYGDPLTDDYGQPIAVLRASFGDDERKGDTVESFSAVSAEQAARLQALLDGAVRTPVYDEELTRIVIEKTQAYFAGLVTENTAAAAVQSAVSEYLKR